MAKSKTRKKSGKKLRFEKRFWFSHWKEMLVLLTLSVIPYLQSLQYGFVLDDQIVVSENNFTKQGFAGIPDILSKDSFYGYLGEQKNLVAGSRYRPLSLVAFAVETEVFGMNPKVFHLLNIFYYFLSCLLIFRVLHIFFRDKVKTGWYFGAAFLTAAFFCRSSGT